MNSAFGEERGHRPVLAYIHTSPWFLSKRNTDWRLRFTLASLAERFPEVQLRVPEEWLGGIRPNLEYLSGAIRFRVARLIRSRVTSTVTSVENDVWKPEIDKKRPDLIISQGFYPMNAPDVPTLWETYLTDPAAAGLKTEFAAKEFELTKQQFKKYGEMAAGIGVRGDYSVGLAKKLFPDLSHKIYNLPFYLPALDPVSDTLTREKQMNRKDVLDVLFVGGQANRKGLPVLLRAMAMVAKRCPGSAHLHIVSGLRDGMVRLPRVDWLTHYGELSHGAVALLFRSAHVYVMPSRIESYGLTYLEGLAHGCVVVARDYEPQREFVGYGKAGLLVDPDSAEDLASKIMSLIEDRRKCVELAMNGLEGFRTRWHWPVVGRHWVTAIRECASRR